MIYVKKFNLFGLTSDDSIGSIPETDMDTVTRSYPVGLYTTFITIQDKSRVVGFSSHIQRLAGEGEDPEAIGEVIRLKIHEILRIDKFQAEVKIRIIRPGRAGEGVLLAESFVPPNPAFYRDGVVANLSFVGRKDPLEKSTEFILKSQHEREANKLGGVYESLIVQNGKIREGFTSNVWFVKDGTLITSARNILKGVTRKVVLDCAIKANIPINLRSLRVGELSSVQEAFITSSSRGVMPLRQIDRFHYMVSEESVTGILSKHYQQALLDASELI